MSPFALLSFSHQALIKLLLPLSLQEVNRIPKGFSNNLAWNLGHVLATEHALCYLRSGQPSPLPDWLQDTFRRGTAPTTDLSAQQWKQLLEWATQQADLLQQDFNKGLFAGFEPYTTSAGIKLESIEDVLTFLPFHNGLHLGYCMALKRAL